MYNKSINQLINLRYHNTTNNNLKTKYELSMFLVNKLLCICTLIVLNFFFFFNCLIETVR